MASTGLTHVLCCEASFAQRSSGFRVGSFDLGFSFPGSKSEFRFGGLGFRVYPVIVGPESLHIKDRFEQWSVFSARFHEYTNQRRAWLQGSLSSLT